MPQVKNATITGVDNLDDFMVRIMSARTLNGAGDPLASEIVVVRLFDTIDKHDSNRSNAWTTEPVFKIYWRE